MTRSLGFWRTWGLVVGSAIGSAVFLVPALLAPYGLLSLAGWLVAALGMLAIAMSLGSLARRVPRIGGPYAYTRAAFGDLAGFMVAWSYWVSCWCGVASISVAFSGYLGVFIPALAVSPAASATAAVTVLWLFTAINIAGVREAAALNLVLTLLKIVPLLVIGVTGLAIGELSTVPMPDTSASASASEDGPSMLLLLGGMLVITMGAFVGLEAGTIPADDVLEPNKTIPRALITGTITIAGVYMLATTGVMALVPSTELAASASPFAAAALKAFGPVGEKIIAIGALISILGVLSATILLAGQMPRAAALDNLFPERFTGLNQQGAPAFALFISSALATVMLVMSFSEGAVAAFEFMFLISTLTAVVVYVICALADLLLQRRDAKAGDSIHLSSLCVAAVAFTTALVALIGSGVELLSYTAILLAAGLPVYWWSKNA